ncbi:hypothetical protein ACRAVF_01250 [Bradyrhizobium oligotrophicum S58]
MPSRLTRPFFSAVATLALTASMASAGDSATSLFKVVTVKDEIVIGLNSEELATIGGNDASAIARALAQKGDLAAWQYNVHRGPNGELQMAPSAKIGLLSHASLRVEPYSTTYVVTPHP